ncbi:hypothetical protein HNP99_003551 [Flavobacterium sp. 28A]|uniref:Cthe_2314 family HEPN domain-containing protein n=1 Tax=Flavobacterium sp. 28A TaxID=2735895 RepID=UPI00157098C7|nr:Cthe_2314 family HEPN domain-containing protein [Flavobacterium sp. 28A]NRT17172.1 hypothetical protein [Flavobacterium sp. 28A]
MHQIENHDLFKIVVEDTRLLMEKHGGKLSDVFIENSSFNEFEYYIHNNGFYLIHFMQLCDQIIYGVELISNFNYNTTKSVSRIDHLTYNIENYIIRLTSIHDRLLQLVNATFHLCINESDVNDRVVLNNMKVSRTNLPKKIKELQKVLQKYTGERNKIVHKYSYLSKELKRLQIFYHFTGEEIYNTPEKIDNFKNLRKEILKEYISEKKEEFNSLNKECFSKLPEILDILLIHYKITKKLIE